MYYDKATRNFEIHCYEHLGISNRGGNHASPSSSSIWDHIAQSAHEGTQWWTDAVAPVALATVNFLSESSIVVYRKSYPVSRETLAAYSLQNGISYEHYNLQITIFDSSSFYFLPQQSKYELC